MKRLIILVAFLVFLLVIGFMGYKLLSSLDHDKQVIDAQRSKESLLIDGLNKDDLFKISIKEYEKIYSTEYDPVYINDQGQKTSIRDMIKQSNCTIDCIHHYSEPFITYDNGNTKVYEFSVDNVKNYLVECANKIDYYIGKEYKKLRKFC